MDLLPMMFLKMQRGHFETYGVKTYVDSKYLYHGQTNSQSIFDNSQETTNSMNSIVEGITEEDLLMQDTGTPTIKKHFVRQSANNRVQNRKVNHSAKNLENPREESKQNTTEVGPNENFSHESQDRWDGAVTDTLGETGVKNDAMFERYKPQNDCDSENIIRNLRGSDSNGSPMQVSLMDKGVRTIQ